MPVEPTSTLICIYFCMSSYLKKLFLSLAVIVSFGSYAAWSANADSNATPSVDPHSLNPTSGDASVTISQATSSAVIPATTPLITQGKFKNGIYLGSVADSEYGNIQVQASISNGKLSDVTFLQYPNDRPNSIEISRRAIPLLRKEAITSQSAHVDGVSGATDTVDAFKRSLGSALAQAS